MFILTIYTRKVKYLVFLSVYTPNNILGVVSPHPDAVDVCDKSDTQLGTHITVTEERKLEMLDCRRNFYSAPQCSHCKRCTSYGNSVRLSVTCRYCVKTTARSTVQFARSGSKMCLVFCKPKNMPQGRPLPPKILARTDLPPPDSSES